MISAEIITTGTILHLSPDGKIRFNDNVKTELTVYTIFLLAREVVKFNKVVGVANQVIDAAKVSTREQRREQEQNENKACEGGAKDVKAHNEMISNGAPSPDPQGNVDPKSPGGRAVVETNVGLKLLELTKNLIETVIPNNIEPAKKPTSEKPQEIKPASIDNK